MYPRDSREACCTHAHLSPEWHLPQDGPCACATLTQVHKHLTADQMSPRRRHPNNATPKHSNITGHSNWWGVTLCSQTQVDAAKATWKGNSECNVVLPFRCRLTSPPASSSRRHTIPMWIRLTMPLHGCGLLHLVRLSWITDHTSQTLTDLYTPRCALPLSEIIADCQEGANYRPPKRVAASHVASRTAAPAPHLWCWLQPQRPWPARCGYAPSAAGLVPKSTGTQRAGSSPTGAHGRREWGAAHARSAARAAHPGHQLQHLRRGPHGGALVFSRQFHVHDAVANRVRRGGGHGVRRLRLGLGHVTARGQPGREFGRSHHGREVRRSQPSGELLELLRLILWRPSPALPLTTHRTLTQLCRSCCLRRNHGPNRLGLTVERLQSACMAGMWDKRPQCARASTLVSKAGNKRTARRSADTGQNWPSRPSGHARSQCPCAQAHRKGSERKFGHLPRASPEPLGTYPTHDCRAPPGCWAWGAPPCTSVAWRPQFVQIRALSARVRAEFRTTDYPDIWALSVRKAFNGPDPPDAPKVTSKVRGEGISQKQFWGAVGGLFNAFNIMS